MGRWRAADRGEEQLRGNPEAPGRELPTQSPEPVHDNLQRCRYASLLQDASTLQHTVRILQGGFLPFYVDEKGNVIVEETDDDGTVIQKESKSKESKSKESTKKACARKEEIKYPEPSLSHRLQQLLISELSFGEQSAHSETRATSPVELFKPTLTSSTTGSAKKRGKDIAAIGLVGSTGVQLEFKKDSLTVRIPNVCSKSHARVY